MDLQDWQLTVTPRDSGFDIEVEAGSVESAVIASAVADQMNEWLTGVLKLA